MMFLEFFVWGGWFVTLGSYLASTLHASGAQTALAYSTQSWGAIIAPFIVGLIADRYFNAERLLGAIHIAGGLLLYALYSTRHFQAFYPCVLAYMILYMPTLALVNPISFRQMDEPARHFGGVRLWGTIGWIVAGLLISYGFAWDSHGGIARGLLAKTFLMSAIASLALGLYSFTLPRTPPLREPGQPPRLAHLLGLDALALLRSEEHTSELQSQSNLVCRLLLEKKKTHRTTSPTACPTRASSPTAFTFPTPLNTCCNAGTVVRVPTNSRNATRSPRSCS